MSAGGGEVREIPGSRRDQAPQWSPDGKGLAFDSFRDGNAEVYLMPIDSLAPVRRLTTSPHYDALGDWTTHGLFWFAGRQEASDEDDYGDSDIWRADPQSGAPRQITTNPGSDTYPTASPDGRWIAFTSHRDGNAEIYTRELASGRERRLTNHPASDDHPRWSPTGEWIAFVSWRDGREQLHLIDPEGEQLVHLDLGMVQARDPAWSPDGRSFVFSARTQDGSDLYRAALPPIARAARVDADEADAPLVRLTTVGGNEIEPAWSPDGKFIAYTAEVGGAAHWGETAVHFLELANRRTGRMRRSLGDSQAHWHPRGDRLALRTSDRDGRVRLYQVRTDGRHSVNLTEENGAFTSPVWSPDGRQLAFAARRAEAPAGSDIYVVDAAGASKRRVTDGRADYRNPFWLPDGSGLVFSADREGNRDIHRLRFADGSLTRLTDHAAMDDFPRVSPDGGAIAFVSQRDGNAEVYLMKSDGSGLRNLTQDAAADGWPAWSPDGRKLVFASKRSGTFDLFLCRVPAELTTSHELNAYQPFTRVHSATTSRERFTTK